MIRSPIRALALAAVLALAAFDAALAAGPADGTWTDLPPPPGFSTMFLDPTDGKISFLEGAWTKIWKFDPAAANPWTKSTRPGSRPDIDLLFRILVDRTGERLLAVGCDVDYGEPGLLLGPMEISALDLRGNSGWQSVATFGTGPSQRETAAIVLDDRDGILYVVGGEWRGEFVPGEGYRRYQYGDVWSLPLRGDRTWREFSVDGAPLPGGTSRNSFFDPGERRIVLVAVNDTLNDANEGRKTWALSPDGDRTWTPLAPCPDLSRVERASFDPVRRELVGIVLDSQDEPPYADSLGLWTFDPSGAGRWTHSRLESAPPGVTPRVYDFSTLSTVDADGHLVTFGGSGVLRQGPNFERADVWRTPLAGPCAWESLYSSIANSDCRWFAPAVLDPGRDRILGVSPGDGLFAFPLDGQSGWDYLPTTYPYPNYRRQGAASVFDVGGERLFVFGGGDQGLEFGDLWELSFAFTPARWRRILTGDDAPRPRRDAGFVYDPVRRRAILFGGWAGEAMNDTWQLDLGGADPVWSRLEMPGVLPAARWGPALVYDSRRDRLVLYAGAEGTWENPRELRDTWTLALEEGAGWSPLPTSGTVPVGRFSPASFYDPRADRMIILGGQESVGSRFDHHALEFGSPSRWQEYLPAGSAILSAEPSTALYDPTRDRALILGTYYLPGYLMRSLTFDRPGLEPPPFPEDGPAFRLLGVGPNPSRGDVSIAFDVPRPVAVRLRLFDVRGRVVRDFGDREFLPGPHVLHWDGRGDDGTRLRDGVYFARLEVEGEVVTGKLVLMD